ncbi:hypothetical protein Tco_0865811 [Tanacetum coccineum]
MAGDENPICTLRDYSKPIHKGYKNTIELPVETSARQTIDQSAGGKLRDQNAKTSWALLEDLALYDNESWNDPRVFAKLVQAITLPQDVPSTSNCRLIKLKNQVQRLMETDPAPMLPTQVRRDLSARLDVVCRMYPGPYEFSRGIAMRKGSRTSLCD